MEYTFKCNVEKEEYMAWLQTLDNYNITQTPMWATVKSDWNHTLCMIYKDGVPVGGALLLIRKFGLFFKMIYSPRGFVIDYSDKEAVRCMTDGVRAYAKKIGAYMVRIDPEITLSTNYKNTVVVELFGKQAMKNLQENGFLHMGFERDFHAYTQPRYNAELSLTGKNGAPLSDYDIAYSFDKKLRKFIGHYTADRGIFFEYDFGKNAIKAFTKITKHTEERQGILLRNEEYFKRIYKAFGEDNVFFFAKLDIDKLTVFLKKQLETGDDAAKTMAQADLETAEKLKKEKGSIIPLSALLTVRSNSTAYLLYSGFDDSVFPRFRTTNQLRFEAMRYFRDCGCKIFSLLGIHGDLNDSLSEFKLKFNPTVIEYAGEFELPIKNLTYKFMRKFFPIMKRVYFKIKLGKR